MSALTLLRAPERALTKVFARKPNGGVTKTSYPAGLNFLAERVEFTGVDGLAALLRDLQGRQDTAVIRAKPNRWHPGPGKRALRRLHHAQELADANGRFRKPAKETVGAEHLCPVTVLAMFEEEPTDWLLLDFEKLALPAGIDWRADLAYTAAFLRLKLPPEFHAARCVYYATGSAADLSKPDLGGDDIRMRLGFVLDRGVTTAKAKMWLHGVEGLDPSTLAPITLIYTAAPVFRDGLVDPMPERLGMLDGEHELVAVPEVEIPPERERYVRTEGGSTYQPGGTGFPPSSDADLVALGEGVPNPGADWTEWTRRGLAFHGASGGSAAGLAAFHAFSRRCSAYDHAATEERWQHWHTSPPSQIGAGTLIHLAREADPAFELPSWRAKIADKEEIGLAEPPKRGLPADEASALLRAEMRLAVERAVSWDGTGQPPRVAFRATPGVGKSTTTIDELAKVPNIAALNVEQYVPGKRQAMEAVARLERAGLVAVWIRGRSAKDIVIGPDGEERQQTICGKAKLARDLAEEGLPIKSTLCVSDAGDCEFKPDCTYLAQFQHNGPAVRILSHAHMFVPRIEELPQPDLIVIDESFWQAGIVDKSLTLDRLRVPTPRSSRRRKKQSREERLADRDHACHLAERVADALRAGSDPREVVTAEQCRWLAGIERHGRNNGGLHADQSHDLQKRLWSERQPDYGDAATMFWEMLAEECEASARPLQRFVLKRHEDRPDVLHLVRRKTSTLPDVPVLMLDADFAVDIVKKFMPVDEVIDVRAARRLAVVQVYDKICSEKSFGLKANDPYQQARGKKRLDELSRGLPRIMPAGGLAVTYKAVSEALEGSLPSNIARGHFGGMRGLDCHKGAEAVAIIGRNEPKAGPVEMFARALHFAEDEPLALLPVDVHGEPRFINTHRRLCMADGSAGPLVPVAVHPDPRCQLILEQIRECESLQDIARVRDVHRAEDAPVYLISNLPLPLEVTAAVRYAGLFKNRRTEALTRWAGVWLCSPSERSRLALDLWPTEKAAKLAAEREGMRAQNAIENISTSTLSPHSATTVEYRYPGQRGSHPHRAYLPGELGEAAARAALEAIVGPVAKLQVVAVEHREAAAEAEQPAPPQRPFEVIIGGKLLDELAALGARLVAIDKPIVLKRLPDGGTVTFRPLLYPHRASAGSPPSG